MTRDTFLHNLFTRYVVVGVIAILATLFLWQTLELVKPSPQYENYCKTEIFSKNITTEVSCKEVGGDWQVTPNVPEQAGYCNATFTCQKEFDQANQEYSRVAFLVLTIAGLVLVLVGIFLRGSQVVSNGILFAGFLSLFTGSVSHWSYMYAWMRALILAVALGIVIYFSWKKFQDEEKA